MIFSGHKIAWYFSGISRPRPSTHIYPSIWFSKGQLTLVKFMEFFRFMSFFPKIVLDYCLGIKGDFTHKSCLHFNGVKRNILKDTELYDHKPVVEASG